MGGNVAAQFIGLQLHSVFQPIIDLAHGYPIGHEALLRARDAAGSAISPLSAFRKAEALQRLVKFDRLCRTLHTLNFLNSGPGMGRLFLNVHPDLLVAVHGHGRVFERVLHQNDVATGQVVIEINESEVAEERQLQEAIANYRERGYRIAIDDFGKQHSNLERLWRLQPEYVKLDGSIIHEAERSDRLQRILPMVVAIVRELGARVIVEGVETRTHLEIAQHAGVQLVQGYFTGKPSSLPRRAPDRAGGFLNEPEAA